MWLKYQPINLLLSHSWDIWAKIWCLLIILVANMIIVLYFKINAYTFEDVVFANRPVLYTIAIDNFWIQYYNCYLFMHYCNQYFYALLQFTSFACTVVIATFLCTIVINIFHALLQLTTFAILQLLLCIIAINNFCMHYFAIDDLCMYYCNYCLFMHHCNW